MLPFRNTLEEDRCKCCGDWFPFDQMDKGYCPDCMDKKLQEEIEEDAYADWITETWDEEDNEEIEEMSSSK